MNKEPGWYLVDYWHEGSYWGIKLWAESFADAEARVRQLQYAKLKGLLGGEIPADAPASGWLTRLWCWWKNLRAV